MATPSRAQLLERLLNTVAAGLLVLALALPSLAQRGAVTAPRNLAELVDEAGVILRGHVISAVVEPHPQYAALWTVVVTLQVDETLKGQAAGTYTFRQFIWDPRDRASSAGYAKGGQMLLLLISPNAQGLSSPAGLEQGRFRLTSDSNGKLFAANGRNNVGLFHGVSARAGAKGIHLSSRAAALAAAPQASGPAALDDLRDLIRQLAGTK
jgi:hypothetical protein